MNNLNSRLLGIALLASAFSFQANAQTAQRLQAVTYTQNNITVDSLAYSYANNSRPCLPTAIFSFSGVYSYDVVSTVGLYDSAINQMQPATKMHDRKEQVISNGIVIKSMDQQSFPSGYVVINTSIFNTTGNIQTQIREYTNSATQLHGFTKDEYTYSGGLLAKKERFSKTGSTGNYVLFSQSTYSYAGGLLTQELYEEVNSQTQSFIPKSRNFYTYNSNNQLIETLYEYYQNNAWRSVHKNKYIYSSTGNLDTQKSYNIINGNIDILREEAIFTYTGGLVSTLEQLSYDYNTGTSIIYTYTANISYNQNNQVTTAIYSNTIPPSTTPTVYLKSNYDYNNDNLLEKAYQQTYDTSTQSWIPNTTDSIKTYYYEPYTPVSVANTHIEEASVSLFPNPAVNMVNITANWKEPQAFTVAIYNTSGQIIRQWAEEPVTDYKKQIPVTDLSAGTYFIKIKGEGTNITKQFNVMK